MGTLSGEATPLFSVLAAFTMVSTLKGKNLLLYEQPGRVAQSVGHLTRRSGVLGSIPGLATYFRFSFRFFKKGSCGESMCTKYWLTA